jgi:spermidine/putrescine transport system ATP-binding protein
MIERGEAEIRLDAIVKRFGDIEAVRGISLEIARGAFFTFLGPSGSGKSTLLHIMAGFEAPSEGRVYFRGEDVTELPANKRGSSTVFQDLALFPHMSVGENVEYGLKIRGLPAEERRRRTERMLALVGLEGFYRRDVNKLSGGQRQRVALARSLVVEPTVLLLDEPLTGLDEILRQQMQYELKRVHRELGTTFVAVTHNQEEALSMSDRIAVLRDGRLEQLGTPRDLYERPVNGFVADFMGAANLLRGTLDPGPPEIFRLAQLGFRVPTGGRPAALGDGTAMLIVRPERIAVGPAAAAHDNRCTLTLADITYLGAALEYRLAFPDGQELRARTLTHNEDAPEPGAAVEVGWSIGDSRLLPADGAGDGGADGLARNAA